MVLDGSIALAVEKNYDASPALCQAVTIVNWRALQ